MKKNKKKVLYYFCSVITKRFLFDSYRTLFKSKVSQNRGPLEPPWLQACITPNLAFPVKPIVNVELSLPRATYR